MKISNKITFYIISLVFFLWGFTTVLNDILIPFLKIKFQLGDAASMMVQFTFFGAYGITALIFYLYSHYKKDIINTIGYKNGIMIGLLVAALGCFLYIPISYSTDYMHYLIPLFIIAVGFTFLQISSNPYVTLLGEEKTATSRLNFAQGINSLGTTLAPIIGTYFLFSKYKVNNDISHPFIILGIIFLIISIVIFFIQLPDYKSELVKTNFKLFNHPNLFMGMMAIFFYVGAEVAIGSKLVEYINLKEIGDFDAEIAGSYVGLYWGGAMIGRLSYSFINNKNLSILKRTIFSILIVFITITIVSVAIFLTTDLGFYQIAPYFFFVKLMFLGMILFRNSPKKLIALFASIIIVFLSLAFIVEGKLALWLIIAIGLFNSIMWSNIFTLSIHGLKELTGKASSLLIIMIIGGAIFSLSMGYIADIFNLKIAYLLPILAYIYILYFGIKNFKIKKV